jgi:hypothetical protein
VDGIFISLRKVTSRNKLTTVSSKKCIITYTETSSRNSGFLEWQNSTNWFRMNDWVCFIMSGMFASTEIFQKWQLFAQIEYIKCLLITAKMKNTEDTHTSLSFSRWRTKQPELSIWQYQFAWSSQKTYHNDIIIQIKDPEGRKMKSASEWLD